MRPVLEPVRVGRRAAQALAGCYIAPIEPRLTVPERGVVTVEEMVLVTKEGAEYLSQPQEELILVG